jgi:peptidoglycan hydrolase-like protein with peptidoglycan-binding domain
MGIYASYRRITPDEFTQLEMQPDFAATFFGWNLDLDDDIVTENYWNALESNERYLDIGRSWQAIHFLLTGEVAYNNTGNSISPLHNVILGGAETEFEAGYGRVRSLTVSDVAEASQALNGISIENLHLRLNLDVFKDADIYPGGCTWDSTGLNQLLVVYNSIVNFFSEAARLENIILISFN